MKPSQLPQKMSCQEARDHIDYLIDLFMDLNGFDRKKYKSACDFYEKHKNMKPPTVSQDWVANIKELGESLKMVEEKYDFRFINGKSQTQEEAPPNTQTFFKKIKSRNTLLQTPR